MIWQGVPLGFDRDGKPIDYHAGDDAGGNAPCLIIGPPGSFKSVGLIAPQLLDDDSGKRSYIVFGDAKGELTSITSKFRSTVSQVAIANYAGVLGIRSDKWNPLGDLDPADGFGDACQAKAMAIVKPEPGDHNKHFTDGARSAATLAIMREVRAARAENRSPDMRAVREFLLQEPKKLRAAIEEIVKAGTYDERTRATKFLSENTEVANLKSTLEVQTSWMTEDICADMATAGGIDFRNNGGEAKTIYFIVPANEMKAKASYIRLALSSALRGLYRHDGMPTTVILEEAYVTGYHEEIEQALSILRGYGSRLTVVFQSYSQIRQLYPQSHGLFTAGAIVAFRPGDMDTARFLVERAGKPVVPVLSASDPSRPGDVGVRPSWQQQQRERIPIDKMFEMPKGRALVWKPGDGAPRISWVKGYFEIPEFNARAESNPYFKGKAPDDPAPTPAAAPRGSKDAHAWFALAALIVVLLLVLLR